MKVEVHTIKENMMPKGKDQYQALPGYENLSWTDHLRALGTSDLLKTDEKTGASVNPRREFLKDRIKARENERKRGSR